MSLPATVTSVGLPSTTQKPSSQLSSLSLDFGSLEDYKAKTHKFRLRNRKRKRENYSEAAHQPVPESTQVNKVQHYLL